MCCVIKGLAVPMFMIRIYLRGVKTADLGQEKDNIWMEAAALEKKRTKFEFFCRASLNAAIQSCEWLWVYKIKW